MHQSSLVAKIDITNFGSVNGTIEAVLLKQTRALLFMTAFIVFTQSTFFSAWVTTQSQLQPVYSFSINYGWELIMLKPDWNYVVVKIIYGL